MWNLGTKEKHFHRAAQRGSTPAATAAAAAMAQRHCFGHRHPKFGGSDKQGLLSKSMVCIWAHTVEGIN